MKYVDYILPETKRTVDDLEAYFKLENSQTTSILPEERCKFAIYLRKSTDDELKQVRSLEDQRTECLSLAKARGIQIKKEDIYEESASAKKSGNRPIFDKLVFDFERQKYQGLIAWSPDRLSRNMKEAGEIIELIDAEKIQYLHFKTYQFDNTPNGKMLLGILFATSKQYSDKLSVDVSRGNTGKINEGKYNGVIKKGYVVDSDGHFMPDSENWDLLRSAVLMKLNQKKTNDEIANFLNDSSFSIRKNEDTDPKAFKFNKKTVGDLFQDSFYIGLYQYGSNMANLLNLYNFIPLMTPDEFIRLNQDIAEAYNDKYAGRKSQAKRLDYGLLREKVICDYCDSVMQFQNQIIRRGENKGKWVISYYCRNKENCIRHNDEAAIREFGHKLKRSVRAKVVMAHIEYTLRNCTKKSKKAYQMYIDRLQIQLAQDIATTKRKLKEAKLELSKHEDMFMKYQNFQVENLQVYKKFHKGKLEYHEKLMKAAQNAIDENEQKLKELAKGLPSEEDFYELTDSYLLKLLETNDLMEQDLICNEVVSNLRVGDDAVSVIKLNPPYNLLVDLTKVSSGRGERT